MCLCVCVIYLGVFLGFSLSLGSGPEERVVGTRNNSDHYVDWTQVVTNMCVYIYVYKTIHYNTHIYYIYILLTIFYSVFIVICVYIYSLRIRTNNLVLDAKLINCCAPSWLRLFFRLSAFSIEGQSILLFSVALCVVVRFVGFRHPLWHVYICYSFIAHV